MFIDISNPTTMWSLPLLVAAVLCGSAVAEKLNIAAFNIQTLGKGKLKSSHIVNGLAEIIRSFDVTVIIEAQGKEDDMKDYLLARINQVSEVTFGYAQTGKKGADHYGVFYDTTKVELQSAKLYPLERILGSKQRNIDISSYFHHPGVNEQGYRLPGIIQIKDIESDQELTLIAMHGHLDKDVMTRDRAVAFQQHTSFSNFKYPTRKQETWGDRNLGTRDVVAYQRAELDLASLAFIYNFDTKLINRNAIILGDLNMDCKYIWEHAYSSALMDRRSKKVSFYTNPIFDASKFSMLVRGQGSDKRDKYRTGVYTNLNGDYGGKPGANTPPCAYDNIITMGKVRSATPRNADIHRFTSFEFDADWLDTEFAVQKERTDELAEKARRRRGNKPAYVTDYTHALEVYNTANKAKQDLYYRALSDHYPISVAVDMSKLSGQGDGGNTVVVHARKAATGSGASKWSAVVSGGK